MRRATTGINRTLQRMCGSSNLAIENRPLHLVIANDSASRGLRPSISRARCAPSFRSLTSFHGPRDDDEDNTEYVDDLAYESFADDETSFDRFDEIGYGGDDLSSQKKPKASKEQRIFMNPKAPLEDRIDRFINYELGALHPLDIVLTAVDLIREAGKRRSFEGMKYAHDVLDRIIEEKRYFNAQRTHDGVPLPYTVVIPERTFEVLMYGWSNLCRKVPIATQRMREVLEIMIQEAEYDEMLRAERRDEGFPIPESVSVRGQEPSVVEPVLMFASLSCQPTVGIYNTLLNGLAQASYRSIASANEAEDVLRRMERLSRGKGWHVKPNTKSFMTVITAFSRTKHASAGQRAEGVLRRMVRYHEEQLKLYVEDIGTHYDIETPSERSRKIVSPDTMAYTAVIQAYGESDAPDSTERSLMLLTEVLESSYPSLLPDAFIFAATINAFARRAAKVNDVAARLDAAEATEDILGLMLETLENREVKGDLVIPFNNCLSAWANANLRESPSRSETILQKMLDPASTIPPSTITFNTCLQVWARAARRDPEAPKRAEDLLLLMEQVDGVEPDVVSYTTLMGAYAKSSRPDKAFQARRILEILLANLATMPARESISAVPFTAVLSAIASSKLPNPPKVAEDDPFGVESDEMTTDDDPYMLALKTYDEVDQDLYELGIVPDHLFFSSMIDVIAAYTSSESIERRQRLERVFEDACSAGEVSSMVVQSLAKASPSRAMLLGLLNVSSWPIDNVNAFPREWTRRVQPQFKKLKLGRAPANKGGARRKPENRKPENRQQY